jgi:hypothetical protein
MHAHQTPSVAVGRRAGSERGFAGEVVADVPSSARLRALSLGYLVPRTRRTGRVHSTFARACNIAFDDMLLTLCTAGAARGPTVLCATLGEATDFRVLFAEGERVEADGEGLRTRRVAVDWSDARVWHPVAPGKLQSAARITAHMQRACASVVTRRREWDPSVIDRDGAAAVTALADACRRCDAEAAGREVLLLVGWGEGLTPAGDDVLAGLIAALDGLMGVDAERRRFREALGAACIACLARTTPIAAHLLRLAAGGHHAEPVLALRDALLTADEAQRVDAALERVLAIGATSGAATASGVLAGVRAWLPDPTPTGGNGT